MSYLLQRKESVGDGIRRIVRQEIDTAIDCLDDGDAPWDKAVHEVRKHCKKIRGVLRLVRFSFDNYRNENVRFRDLARKLSSLRNAHVMQGTHRDLVEHISTDASLAALNETLASHTEPVLEHVAESLETVRVGFNMARESVDGWNIVGNEFDTIAGGLRTSYQQARKGLRRSRKRIDDARLHDWRKRVKYHWYHMRLLNDARPTVIKGRAVAADHLSRLLGDDHDIAVYLGFLRGISDNVPARAVTAIQRYADERRTALQEESLAMGMRLFAEKPKRIVERFETYWNAWS